MARFRLGKKIAHEIHELDAEGIARHPHQRQRLLLFGILIAALSLGAGFALIHSERQSQKDLLTKVGAQSMSAPELKSDIAKAKFSFTPYWLGAMTGLTYTADTSKRDEVLIRYIKPAADPTKSGTNVYTVESYESELTYNKDVLHQDFATDAEFTTNGRTVQYLKETMAYLTVRIPDSKQIFEIHCFTAQTLLQLEGLANGLIKVN